ncbi:hypothetical protein MKD33_10785, partial [Chromobacterium piscinae]
MLRISELKLPLDHTPEELADAVAGFLKVAAEDVRGFTVFKRSYDARKGVMSLVYIIDVDVANEDKLFARFKGDRRVMPTPDTNYYYVGQAP